MLDSWKGMISEDLLQSSHRFDGFQEGRLWHECLCVIFRSRLEGISKGSALHLSAASNFWRWVNAYVTSQNLGSGTPGGEERERSDTPCIHVPELSPKEHPSDSVRR